MAAQILARRQIRLAAVAALAAAGIGKTVESPGDWTAQPERLPLVMVRATRGSKEPFTRGAPDFTSIVEMEIETKVQAGTELAAQDAIEELDQLVEQALFTNYAFIRALQKFSVESVTEVSAEGRQHAAGTLMTIRCELQESFDPLVYAPPVLQPVAPDLAGMDVHVDMVAPFDANGTYPDSPFVANIAPAPRLSGPDGRDEASLQFNFPL